MQPADCGTDSSHALFAKVTILSDWELWACARQQVERYGDDTFIHAGMRSVALLEDGDRGGHRAWLAIIDHIEQISGVCEGEVRHRCHAPGATP